jgi:hypothetical protein
MKFFDFPKHREEIAAGKSKKIKINREVISTQSVSGTTVRERLQ